MKKRNKSEEMCMEEKKSGVKYETKMNDGEGLEMSQKIDKNMIENMEERKKAMNLKEAQNELVEARQKRGWKETKVAARYKMQTRKKEEKKEKKKESKMKRIAILKRAREKKF